MVAEVAQELLEQMQYLMVQLEMVGQVCVQVLMDLQNRMLVVEVEEVQDRLLEDLGLPHPLLGLLLRGLLCCLLLCRSLRQELVLMRFEQPLPLLLLLLGPLLQFRLLLLLLLLELMLLLRLGPLGCLRFFLNALGRHLLCLSPLSFRFRRDPPGLCICFLLHRSCCFRLPRHAHGC